MLDLFLFGSGLSGLGIGSLTAHVSLCALCACGEYVFAVIKENEIPTINEINMLHDQHLYSPCICREKLHLAMKSGCC